MSITDAHKYKLTQNGLNLQFEIQPLRYESENADTAPAHLQIARDVDKLNEELQQIESKITELDETIEKYTTHADKMDYILAASSGLLCGFMDVFWVGAFDFKKAKKWSYRTVNRFVADVADMLAAQENKKLGRRLKAKIKFLEEHFGNPSDSAWRGRNAGVSAKTHHLDDWSHHPTIFGLFFSILTQFTYRAYFFNRNGESFVFDAKRRLIQGTGPLSKIMAGTINWFCHLLSDAAGTSGKTVGHGMGIPGPLLSMLREFAQLIPGKGKNEITQILTTVFTKYKFDLRSELAVAHELGRQALPVIINDVFVRVFYLFRRLMAEIDEQKKKNGNTGSKRIDWESLNWQNVLPHNNRTISRMLTIASGTFVAVDCADASIRATIKSRGKRLLFMKEFALRVNYVGVTHFAIRVTIDIKQGYHRMRLRNLRLHKNTGLIWTRTALSAKQDAETWLTVTDTAKCVAQTLQTAQVSIDTVNSQWKDIAHSLKGISRTLPDLRQRNPSLVGHMNYTLRY